MEPRLEWSTDVEQADWIRGRLAPFHSGEVTSVVPRGFPAYARVLHPARGPAGRAVRWAEVAARSGVEMLPETQFHEIALLPPGDDPASASCDDAASASCDDTAPESRDHLPLVSTVQAPEEGTLRAADATVLADVLRRHTSSPDDCWFCLWDGYGWGAGARWYRPLGRADDEPNESAQPAGAAPPTRRGSTATYSGRGQRPDPARSVTAPPDPVPRWVRDGPRVELPERSYVLYRGAVEHATAFVDSERKTANLWWPRDRTWCVATEIDLDCTYIGGSEKLVEDLVRDGRLEAWRVDPAQSHHLRPPPWLDLSIEDAVARLLAGQPARIETSRGTVTARLRRPGRLRHGDLWTTSVRPDGSSCGESWTSLSRGADEALADNLRHELLSAALDLLE
ncbi:MAG TPA: hypothetical protein VFJ12_13345 [Segeticoccus sp.]|nr:hypothetical protein [Segeticoccus sp.]